MHWPQLLELLEFFLNFDKAAISSKVMEFLEININQDEDKQSFARLLKVNKLLYKEAIVSTILGILGYS